MRQYYRPVIDSGIESRIVYNRRVDGEYTPAMLMEHSWWYNDFVGTICWILYLVPHRIAWVGDYSNEEQYGQLGKELHDIAWAKDEDGVGVAKDVLLLDGKVILNHTKKMYVCCDEYKQKSVDRDGWVAHPLPLLTAIGNGSGGGDYRGVNEEDVGCWCFDEIEVADMVKEGYAKFDIFWKED